ncbi:unnamed protein product [Tuber aestivum]|uniref:Uncharacterized protein n=1 Tax=Tuber aestivum TaxID=59557 RepID=A0A292Q2P0_9PEZI|nr:unnamed protein product [Tuber aestivum]
MLQATFEVARHQMKARALKGPTRTTQLTSTLRDFLRSQGNGTDRKMYESVFDEVPERFALGGRGGRGLAQSAGRKGRSIRRCLCEESLQIPHGNWLSTGAGSLLQFRFVDNIFRAHKSGAKY